MLIFEKSQNQRRNLSQRQNDCEGGIDIPQSFLREDNACLPETSELQTVRHFTKLSRSNFSIDTQFYPLGSCTMKYNPRAAHRFASLPGFVNRHPYARLSQSQGFLRCAYELQNILADVTGMSAVSLAPMAGAQGEFAGVAMIKAYHQANSDTERDEILVPDAAHGTNPASAVMCGYKVREIKTGRDGDIDIEDLKAALGPKTAGIMLTNPSTLGVFDRKIEEIAGLVHEAGGLLYYDGANLNAILGRVRPGDMGFDVMHLNLHKTFATPHGGGGPGSGPVAVGPRLVPFIPTPFVLEDNGQFSWSSKETHPQTIGRLSAFMGNAGIILRAYIYARLLGAEGMRRVSDFATLNANYLMKRLQEVGFELAYPERRATHEFIVTLRRQAKEKGITAMDLAKRLLDYDMHAPTTYFPLLVAECLLIEPTETESKETLDTFVDNMAKILEEIDTHPDMLKQAPHRMSVSRLDDVKAARELDLTWSPQ